MKLFTKLALVSAIAVSGSAMAMESMDDSSLSSTTGQDGISLGIALDHVSIDSLYIHDNDGLTTTALGGTSTAGAITITGNGTAGDRNETAGIDITANAAGGLAMFGTQAVLAKLVIDSDAGTVSGAGTGAFLNIAAEISGLDISIGKIGVAASNAPQTTGAVRGVVAGTNNTIIDGLNLKTGLTTANIQLGATPQGAMININGTMQGGLEISDLGLVDNAGGGTIRLGKISVADHAGPDLTTNAKISVVPGALKIEAMSTATDVYIKSIQLGDFTGAPAGAIKSIGDVEISNMQVSHGGVAGAIILVSGH